MSLPLREIQNEIEVAKLNAADRPDLAIEMLADLIMRIAERVYQQ